MTEILREYRKAEMTILAAKRRKAQLEQDSELQKELEFERRIIDVVKRYRKNVDDAINVLDMYRRGYANAVETVKKESVKLYRNPYTGEVVKAKRKTKFPIKQWIEEYGHGEVERWEVKEDIDQES